jgi:hypothetical protein
MEQRKKKGIPEKTYLSARVRFPLSFSSVSPTALDTIAFFLSLDLSLWRHFKNSFPLSSFPGCAGSMTNSSACPLSLSLSLYLTLSLHNFYHEPFISFPSSWDRDSQFPGQTDWPLLPDSLFLSLSLERD